MEDFSFRDLMLSVSKARLAKAGSAMAG